MTHCIIVGGGIIGLMQARALALEGWRVTVLEQGDVGRESSWAGGGILSPLYPWRYPEAVSQLAAWGQDYYPILANELVAEGGIDPQWTQSGLLILDGHEHDQARAWAQRRELPCLELDYRAQCERVPRIQSQGEPALWFPTLGQIRNPRLMKSLLSSCLSHGVQINPHTPVRGLLQDTAGVQGVITAQGQFTADRVIIASGAWSALLLKDRVELPVHPVKGQMILLRGQPGMLNPIVLYQDRYLIPRRDGRILVGSTVEETGFDKQVSASARQELLGFVRKILPGLAELPVEAHWAGLRPASPLGIPYICQVRDTANLYVNTGHFRNGVILAPASVRLLTDLLMSRAPILDPAPYQLG